MIETRIISKKTLEELRFLKRKTQIGEAAMLRDFEGQRPAGLDAGAVKNWLSGKVSAAPAAHIDFVLRQWRTIWREGRYLVPLTENMQAYLVAQQERTGVYPADLLRQSGDVPLGLTVARIRSWLSGTQKSVRKAQLDWVMNRWEGLPNLAQARSRRIALDGGMIAELQRHREATGKSARALLD